MWSVRRRRRLASQPVMMWCRDSPASLGPSPHRHPHLGGQQYPVPAAVEHLADDLLGQAAGVDVGGVDEVDPGVQAHVHLPPGLVCAGRPDVGKVAPPAERHCAHGEHGHPQT
jgi:hypothetical protein